MKILSSNIAYLFDDKSLKIKSSYGTEYPSLYEMFFVYAANSHPFENVKAENSQSFDIGLKN